MIAASIFGWAGTVTGVLLGLPQLIRLIRTRNVEGLSLIAWQAMLAVNLGWTMHGIRIDQPPQYITSALSLVATVPILILLSQALNRRFVLVALPGLAFAALMTGVDHLWGSAAYGVVAIIPAIVSNAGQSLELIKAPRVNGVSVVFLALAAGNQVIWLTWAILVHDPGTVIAAITNGVFTAFNLAWYVLRRLGLRAFGTKATAGTVGTDEGSPLADRETRRSCVPCVEC